MLKIVLRFAATGMLRLSFACGQTHFCESAPALYSTNKTKRSLKRPFEIIKSFLQNDGGTGFAAAALIACGNRHAPPAFRLRSNSLL